MTSGVKWNEDYSDPKSDVSMRNLAAADAPGEPLINYMRQLPRETAPGSRFHYSTGEADLVGVVVRRALGGSLAEYLSERIWKPFGMERDASWMLDPSGHEIGGCCISMTLRDYGRFGLFMLRAGVLADGRRVLPEGWTALATQKQIEAYPGMGYGYLWWAPDVGASFDADGIFGQLIHVVPSKELVVVHNSAWPRPVGQDVGGARIAFVLAVQSALEQEPGAKLQ
jgi:CubicO group peptidase (beta-lactamase class C family)